MAPSSSSSSSSAKKDKKQKRPSTASAASGGVGSIGVLIACVVGVLACLAGVLHFSGIGKGIVSPEANRLIDEARALLQRNNLSGALPKLLAAKELAPEFATIYFMLGLCYQNTGKVAEALEVYTKCLELPNRGNKGTCANNAGVLYMRTNQYAESEKAFLTSIEISGDWLQPHMNLGKLYWGMDDYEKSHKHYLIGHRLNPSDELWLHISTLLPKIYTSHADLLLHHKRYVEEVDKMWRRTDISMTDPLVNFETVFPYYLSYHGENDVATYKKIADITRRGDPSLSYVAEHVKQALALPQLPAATRAPGEKIRVGFSSLYFKTHASAKMIRGVIENLDHDKFHIVVFALRERGDAPNPNQRDEFSMGIRRASHKYVDLPKNSMQFMRAAIEKEKLDVMIFAEIGMDPANYLLSFSRLAPVNIATHGHASTTGVPTIDYYVTYRPFEIQGAQAHYNEKLVTMPGFSYYHWPHKASRQYTHEELGLLKEYPHVYACTQTLWKITPDFDEVFRQILLRDPKGQLVLKQYSPRGAEYLGAKLRERMRNTLADVYDRVLVLSALSDDQYLGLLQAADVVLDSYPFGGYTTSLECFGMGVPVVTLPHPLFAGRCTYGFYKLMNFTDLVASTREEYIDLALKMANNKDFNTAMRAKVAARNSVLFESRSAVNGWNEFLEQAATGKPVTYLHEDASANEFADEINADWPAA